MTLTMLALPKKFFLKMKVFLLVLDMSPRYLSSLIAFIKIFTKSVSDIFMISSFSSSYILRTKMLIFFASFSNSSEIDESDFN